MIEYKGYTGVFEFDPSIDAFHGRVVGLRDVVTFQGRSLDELRRDREEARATVPGRIPGPDHSRAPPRSSHRSRVGGHEPQRLGRGSTHLRGEGCPPTAAGGSEDRDKIFEKQDTVVERKLIQVSTIASPTSLHFPVRDPARYTCQDPTRQFPLSHFRHRVPKSDVSVP